MATILVVLNRSSLLRALSLPPSVVGDFDFRRLLLNHRRPGERQGPGLRIINPDKAGELGSISEMAPPRVTGKGFRLRSWRSPGRRVLWFSGLRSI
ncbi:MAG: hypothetical protein O3B74_10230, partial [Proteobacteria bacterium]|nr:hypothetical protein [Pseudomonadota bacterium]